MKEVIDYSFFFVKRAFSFTEIIPFIIVPYRCNVANWPAYADSLLLLTAVASREIIMSF